MPGPYPLLNGVGLLSQLPSLFFKRQLGARPDRSCPAARLCSRNTGLSLRIIRFIYFIGRDVGRIGSWETQFRGRLSYGLFVTLDKSFVSSSIKRE